MDELLPVIRVSLEAKTFEQDDPFELRGIVFPADEATSREMARCFVEEYALLGFPREAVARLFESPAFHGTHALVQQHGRAFIEHLLDAVFGPEGTPHAQGV